MDRDLVMDRDLGATRRSLHAVAEFVLAGPQYAATGTIRLRVVPGGFATTAGPDLRVAGGSLVRPGPDLPMDGHTPRTLAGAVGVEPRALGEVFADGAAVGMDDELDVDEVDARVLLDALALGDAGLRAFAPETEPVLWPEHFDVAVTVDEVNYGVSHGDAYLAVPYAYVGPWAPPPATDEFWSAPFGSVRAMSDLADPEAVRAYFAEGRDRLGR